MNIISSKLIYLILYLFLVLTSLNLNAKENNSLDKKSLLSNNIFSFPFQNGDILLQDMDCGDLCDAIEKVTIGIDGKKFSHIGLLYLKNDSNYVIEAIGDSVQITTLKVFVNRSKDIYGNPKIVIARLKNQFQNLNLNAVNYAISKVGTPYDDEFIYDNNKYYCSELIYDAYKNANNNEPFFELEPMTFKDPNTGETLLIWETYYKKLNIKIPEGELGCNPAGLSRSKKVEIIKSFY